MFDIEGHDIHLSQIQDALVSFLVSSFPIYQRGKLLSEHCKKEN